MACVEWQARSYRRAAERSARARLGFGLALAIAEKWSKGVVRGSFYSNKKGANGETTVTPRALLYFGERSFGPTTPRSFACESE